MPLRWLIPLSGVLFMSCSTIVGPSKAQQNHPSELRVENYSLLVSDLGSENPLPPLPQLNPPPPPCIVPGVPDEDRKYLGWGDVNGVMPYRLQDQYVRDPRQQELRVAVLENDYLRATFLLDFGGRLWSLLDKRSGRELLHNNRVLQPANLARRNAWFSGGRGMELRHSRPYSSDLLPPLRCPDTRGRRPTGAASLRMGPHPLHALPD